ncbi:hypothetical protein [Bacillus sp. FSL H8-0515]|uniref:hypothetical protein n=1 Tax=Bacillus sp. FSL H8-0515 TaxID=2921396 RepID=UPI0030FCB37C
MFIVDLKHVCTGLVCEMAPCDRINLVEIEAFGMKMTICLMMKAPYEMKACFKRSGSPWKFGT